MKAHDFIRSHNLRKMVFCKYVSVCVCVHTWHTGEMRPRPVGSQRKKLGKEKREFQDREKKEKGGKQEAASSAFCHRQFPQIWLLLGPEIEIHLSWSRKCLSLGPSPVNNVTALVFPSFLPSNKWGF